MRVIGLFAGIGGIEYGLHEVGIETTHLCEIMPEAQSVLSNHFPKVKLFNDVTKIHSLPQTDILTAGFPCQDISIAGNKVGITGSRSSLVNEVFRLIKTGPKPSYVIIENVANIISLNKGEAIRLITSTFTEMGYEWAYRLIDPRTFGIPQRRPRFVFVASNVMHPKEILFPDDEDVDAAIMEKCISDCLEEKSYGFYWTEGKIGIGWAKDSIPPLKCGSTLGLPSAPAVWDIRNNFFGTPSLIDAERLQGFPPDWTRCIVDDNFRNNNRWKLIGNAVNTKVSSWVGTQITKGESTRIREYLTREHKGNRWPKSAYSDSHKVFSIKSSPFPLGIHYEPILDFLQEPLVPLSLKATLGFLNRVNASTSIKYPIQFKESIIQYLNQQYHYEYKNSGTI